MAHHRESELGNTAIQRRRMREKRMRQWIGGQLRRPGRHLPSRVWAQLCRNGSLTDPLASDESLTAFLTGESFHGARGEVLNDARAYYSDYRQRAKHTATRTRRRANAKLPPADELEGQILYSKHLTPVELKRAKLLTLELGRIANAFSAPSQSAEAGEPLVDQFRNHYLEGKLLSHAEAEELLGSIGAAIFEFEFFCLHRIPLVGHTSRVVPPSNENGDWSKPGLNPETEIEFLWNGKSKIERIGSRARHVDHSVDELGPFTRGKHRILRSGRISVLARLMDVAVMLCFKFPWSLRQSALLVLTGTVPYTAPIAVRLLDHSTGPSHALTRIQLTVQPWLSADAVLRVYRRAQRILIGPRNRPPKSRSLELFEFVSEHRHRGATFPEVLAAWLAAHPSERKKYPKRDPSSVARFTSSHRDVERQVLRPFGRPDSKEAAR